MTISPVIARELMVALRKNNPRKSRMVYACIGVGLAVLCLLFGRSAAPVLHKFLFYLGLTVAVPGTLELASDLFSQERQNGSFGFLFLAGLTVPEMFGGKVLGSFLVSSINLLAITPCLAVPFLTGGISFSTFAETMVCLPNLLIFTLSTVCFASACSEEESSARVVAIFIAAALSLIPLGLFELTRWTAHPISHFVRSLSPAWGPWILHRDDTLALASEFWPNAICTLGWSCLFFIFAGVALRRAWNQDIAGHPTSFWTSKLRDWFRGDARWRRRNLGWLDSNPYVWLTMRNRQSVQLAWLVIIVASMVAALFCLASTDHWIKEWMLVGLALAAHISIEWILAYTAAKCLGDERRSGAVELLLTTPLKTAEIVLGATTALNTQFRPVFRAIIPLQLTLMTLGLFITRTWTTAALWDYLVLWGLLILWTAIRGCTRLFSTHTITPMWAGYNTGMPGLAVARSMGFYRFWYWNLFCWSNAIMSLTSFPSGSWFEIILVNCAALGIIASIIHCANHPAETASHKVETMMLSEFRRIAPEPLPDRQDPRLKNWTVNQRLYHHYPNQILTD